MNYHNFSKFRGIKPKIDKLTNSTQLYPSLESKKSWLLFKGDLWLRDLLVKTQHPRLINGNCGLIPDYSTVVEVKAFCGVYIWPCYNVELSWQLLFLVFYILINPVTAKDEFDFAKLLNLKLSNET